MVKAKRVKKENDLPPYDMIKDAVGGDIDAITRVLKFYEAYITSLSVRKLYDENGNIHYFIDESLKRRLETKLITKILSFKMM